MKSNCHRGSDHSIHTFVGEVIWKEMTPGPIYREFDWMPSYISVFCFFFFLNIYSSIWVQFLILINSTIMHFNTHAIHLNLNSNFPYSVQPLTHQIYYGHWFSASTCSDAFFIFCCIHFDVYACTCVYMCVHLSTFEEIFEGMWRDMWRALLIIEHKLCGRLNNGPQRYLDPSPWNLCYLTW